VYPSINLLKRDSLELWKSTSFGGITPMRACPIDEQSAKEYEVDRLMGDVDATLKKFPDKFNRLRKAQCIDVRSRIQKAIVQLLHTFGCVIDETMETQFSSVTDEFINRAYDFDPEISDEAVYQAARNVLIMNTIQMHLGKEIALTPSVFAYSMLYPYTDNYIDQAGVDAEMKREANDRLLLRLNGISVSPYNQTDDIIYRLICMIEEEFDRSRFPAVFESLLGIHKAQIRSISQTDGGWISFDQLLDLSIEKGGTSVLADGHLVAGKLGEEDAIFLFRFGSLLQLIDDLQDLREDGVNGQRTLVGHIAETDALDSFTDHLLSFLNAVVGPDTGDRAGVEKNLAILIERSCRLLILEAMAMNERSFSAEYVARMESYSPVRFKFLRDIQMRLSDNYKSRRPDTRRLVGRKGVMAGRKIAELVR